MKVGEPPAVVRVKEHRADTPTKERVNQGGNQGLEEAMAILTKAAPTRFSLIGKSKIRSTGYPEILCEPSDPKDNFLLLGLFPEQAHHLRRFVAEAGDHSSYLNSLS